MQTLLVSNVPEYVNEDEFMKTLCKQFGQPALASSIVLADRKCSLPFSRTYTLTKHTHTGGVALLDFDKDAVLIDLDFLNFQDEELTYFRLIDSYEDDDKENFVNPMRITASPPSPPNNINQVVYPPERQSALPRPYQIFFTKSSFLNRTNFERDMFELLQCPGMRIAAELGWNCTDQAALLFRTAAARDEAAHWLWNYNPFSHDLVDFELKLALNPCIVRVDRVSAAISERTLLDVFQHQFNGRVVDIKMSQVQLYDPQVDKYMCFALELANYAAAERLMDLSGSREVFSMEVEPRAGESMVTVGPFPASFADCMFQILQNEFGPILNCERERPAFYHGLHQHPSVCHITFADEETAKQACETKFVQIGARFVWVYRD